MGGFMKQKKKRRLRLFLLSIILVIIAVFICIIHISNQITPFLVNYAKKDASTILVDVMNQVVQKKVTNAIRFDNLFLTSRDSTGMITMIDFNPSQMNQIVSTTNTLIQKSVQAIEEGNLSFFEENEIPLDEVYLKKMKNGRITQIPMGAITNNSLLANLGPKIPVKIHFVGTGGSHLTSRMSNYGINNTLLETFIEIELNIELLLPLSIETVSITSSIPLSITMIQGKVPSFYQGELQKNDSTQNNN